MSQMSEINRVFTSSSLKIARAEARDNLVEIGKLTTYRFTGYHNGYFEVYEDGNRVWEGSAYDASEAKSKYIWEKMKKAEARKPCPDCGRVTIGRCPCGE